MNRRLHAVIVDQHHAVHGHAVDLPDAEHIHLHRRPDGTWSAVPMWRVWPARTDAADVASSDALRRCAWVDVPADPESEPLIRTAIRNGEVTHDGKLLGVIDIDWPDTSVQGDDRG